LCYVRKHGNPKTKICYVNRFVWECYKGSITDRKVIDHINDVLDDNRYYNSLYAVQQHLGVHNGLVKNVCEKKKYHKTGLSKKDGCSYSFELIDKEDLPTNHFQCVRLKITDEERKQKKREWWNKEFVCPKCNKILKNGNRYYHKKICNDIAM